MSYEAERAIAKAALAEPGEWYTPADDDEDEIIRILSRVDLAHIATFNPEFCLGLLDLAEKAERYEIHARALDDLARVQSQDGNWNHDAYMHGMANGIILAQNCIRSGGLDEPVFLDAPTVWLADIPAALNPTEANDD